MVVASWEVAIKAVVLTEVSYLFNLFLNHRGQLYTPDHDVALKVADLVWFFNDFIDAINWLRPAGLRLPSAGC